jgi:hypothetical protein
MTRAKQLLEQLEMVGNIRVSNTPRRFSRLAKELDLKQRGINGNRIRFLEDADGYIYYWCSFDGIHSQMAEALGLDYTNCIAGEIQYIGGPKGWGFVTEVRDGQPLQKSPDVAELLSTFRYDKDI